MPSRALPNSLPSASAPAGRIRRIAVGLVFLLGSGGVLLGGHFLPPYRALAIILGLVLAATASIYLGVELLLRLAVRVVQQRRLEGD
jgi:hypothetical protein